MGNDLTKGTTYIDGQMLNAANLNAHVDDAALKSTAISARTAKITGAVTDEFLINDGGTLKKMTGTVLYDMVTQTGAIIQSTYGASSGYGSSSAIIPLDDTIPQISEGAGIFSLSFTPRFANSRMVVRFSAQISGGGAITAIAAIFRDTAGTNAITARAIYIPGAGASSTVNIIATDLPASVATITYSVRIGPGAAGSIYFNGSNSARFLGGSSVMTLEVQEVRVP